jgi:hypothetical protein
VALLALLPGCGDAPQRYADRDTGCAFSYPAGWEIRGAADTATALRVANVAGAAGQEPSAFVIIEPPARARLGFAPRIEVVKFALDAPPTGAAAREWLAGAFAGEGVAVVPNPLPDCAVPHCGLRIRAGGADLLQYAFAFAGARHLTLVIIAYGADHEDPDVTGVIASIARADR